MGSDISGTEYFLYDAVIGVPTYHRCCPCHASAISGDMGCDLELGLVQAKCGFSFQYYLIVACGNTAGARDKATRRANQFNTNGDQKIRATRLRSKENSYRISFI